LKSVSSFSLAGIYGKPGNIAVGMAKAIDFKAFPAEAAQNSIFPSSLFRVLIQTDSTLLGPA
jgi:hypothetical protein